MRGVAGARPIRWGSSRREGADGLAQVGNSSHSKLQPLPIHMGEDAAGFGQVEIFLFLSHVSPNLAALPSSAALPFFPSLSDFKENELVPAYSPDWARPNHSLSSGGILQPLIFETHFASSQNEMQQSHD